MIFETIEAKGLAHLSYLVGDEAAGIAVVIDPKRDIDDYLALAQKHQVKIVGALETHIHADFVSGSNELRAKTGATIYGGKAEGYGFPITQLSDGDTIPLGALTFTALHTPGHTPEHVSYLVEGGKSAGGAWGLFSGDLLFAGEVGRPDLLGEEEKLALAKDLYQSFHEKIIPLDDGIEVFPAHGEGSPCGGSIGDRRTTTVGYEKANNAKLQPMSEGEFVDLVLSDLPPAPRYYPRMKKINLVGPPVVGDLPSVPPIMPADLEKMSADAVQIIDTREIEGFGGGHVPGSINIPLRGEFPVWSGWMIDPNRPVVFVLCNEAQLDDVQRHLFRIGVDDVKGYLRGGMKGWFESGQEFATVPQMSVHTVGAATDGLQILDVRSESEFAEGHVDGAEHCFVPHLETSAPEGLKRDEPLVVYCGSGYRASVAASVLRRMGFTDVRNMPGSMKAWKAAGLPLH